MSVPYVTESMVKKVLHYKDLIPAIEQTLVNFSTGKVNQPLRQTAQVKPHNGYLMSMSAFDEQNNQMALKVISLYPDNEEKGYPSHACHVLYFDPTTGVLKALIQAEALTHFRTAAASAVATKYLAPTNSKVLAILGAGNQARSHLHALTTLQKFEKINIWNRTKERGQKLATDVSHLAPEVNFCDTVKDAVSNADVITTVTTAYEPVLLGEWLKEGVHINSVGGCRPNWREMDDNCMRMCDIFVDSYDGAKNESGDIILSKATVSAEIGEVIHGSHLADRNKRTIFKSLGIACWDVAAAALIWKKLQEEK